MKKTIFLLFAFCVIYLCNFAQTDTTNVVANVLLAADEPIQKSTNYMFYIYGIAGVLFHLVMKIRDAYTKGEKFNWATNGIFSVFSLITAMVLVVFRDEIFIYLGLDMTNFTVFLLGYFSDSVWKNVKAEKAKEFKVPTDQSN